MYSILYNSTMAEFVTGVLGTAFMCSVGMVLYKLCETRAEVKDVSSEYLLIFKEHYAKLKKKQIITEPPLPIYTAVESRASISNASISNISNANIDPSVIASAPDRTYDTIIVPLPPFVRN